MWRSKHYDYEAPNERTRLTSKSSATHDGWTKRLQKRLLPKPFSLNCSLAHLLNFFLITFLLLLLLGLAIAAYFYYFHVVQSLRIVSLNTWGMPAAFGTKDKQQRMAAIAKEIGKGEYDLFLLEQLWMHPDHATIAAAMPHGFHITGFRQLALPTCEGRIGPDWCSGLAVVSRFPFEEIGFNSYTLHGDVSKMFIDGEWLARKGVGRVRVRPPSNGSLSVDVFVTHTAADPDPKHGYNNSYYRRRQVRELMSTYVARSSADLTILGGDLNAPPDFYDPESPYALIRRVMHNSIEEVYSDWWLKSEFATFGNPRNSYSYMREPVIQDYIFHKTRPDSGVVSWTRWFDLPWMMARLPGVNKTVSVSDHEPIRAVIFYRSPLY